MSIWVEDPYVSVKFQYRVAFIFLLLLFCDWRAVAEELVVRTLTAHHP